MIITNARIFNGKEFIKENSIEVKNGKIFRIFYQTNIKNKKVIDLNNQILSPGFIDVHSHGAGGINSLEIKNKQDIKIIKENYAKYGTTSVVLTSVYSYFKKDHLRKIKKYKNINSGARILGVYLESPFINLNKKGMIQDQYVMKPVDSPDFLIKDVVKSCGSALKIITVAPEIKESKKIIRYFNKKGVIVAFGHSMADYNETKRAVKNGIKTVTHFLNAMNPIHHRQPGPAIAILEDKSIYIEIIADGNHIHPSIIKIIYKLAGKDGIILITDATGDKILKDGIYENKRYGKVVIKNNGVYSLDGILIGTNLTLLDMCKNMKKWLSLKIEDVLQMVTYNPHKLLNEKIGIIKKDFFADFIVLDDDLNLKKVFVNNRWIKY